MRAVEGVDGVAACRGIAVCGVCILISNYFSNSIYSTLETS